MTYVALGARFEDRRQSPSFHHDPSKCTDFDWISERCSGAMALRHCGLARAQPSLFHRSPYNILLRRAMRGRHACTPSVLVHGTADEHRQAIHRVHGVGAILELHGPAAFSPGVSIRGVVEGKAPALGGQHSRPAQRYVGARANERVDRKHQGVIKVGPDARRNLMWQPSPHRHVGHTTGHKAGRAGRLGAADRPHHAHRVGKPLARHRVGTSSKAVLCYSVAHLAPVRARVANVDTAIPPLHGLAGVPCVVQGFVANLEDNPLQGSHDLGFLGTDAEETVVEALHLLLGQQPTVFRHGKPQGMFRPVVDVQVPPGNRHLHLGVAAGGEHVPEVVKVVGKARVASLDAHHVDAVTKRLGWTVYDSEGLLSLPHLQRHVQDPGLESDVPA
mmetsp:Transcript_14633/g.32052  ORF Transcript_14633/g.32052 Transcript_14633/m.32052 type:complete len:389 (+) Transcript_14633:413-1579(+)